jgi:hypothetical protein
VAKADRLADHGEYDIGFYDKRNPRGRAGAPLGHMGHVLTYLEIAAKETGHPELAVAPIAPYKDAKGFAGPVWLPDEYAASMWRSYHSNCGDLRITAPKKSWRKGYDRTEEFGAWLKSR